MDPAALDRARTRLAEASQGRADATALEAVVERARDQLQSFAEAAAELEVTVPERIGDAIHESLRTEVLPVARQLAEVRGLSAQAIRRLERMQGDLDAERRARVDDLAVLVDLIVSGWRGFERRVDRLERILEHLEGSLQGNGLAALARSDDGDAGAEAA